jgi:hypothetical protein
MFPLAVCNKYFKIQNLDYYTKVNKKGG